MNRMEEALRRAGQDPKLSVTADAEKGTGLEAFASADQIRTDIDLEAASKSADIPLTPDALRSYGSVPAFTVADALPAPVPANGTHAAASLKLSPTLTGKVVVSDAVKGVTVEQYRRLAAALHHAQCDSGIKVVMAASALPGEGKTLTAVNLALTLSQSYGRHVLLIDADFRRPTLHEVFQVPNVTGLNEALKADADRKLTIIEVSPTLSLLPAGRPDPDPMSGLTSGRMRRIIEEAASKFDWVVLDTPPIGLITDAHLLAAMVNVAVLVIHAGRTPFSVIQRAVESLDRSRVIGVVLNRVDEGATTPGGKYGGHYASYYRPSSDVDEPSEA